MRNPEIRYGNVHYTNWNTTMYIDGFKESTRTLIKRFIEGNIDTTYLCTVYFSQEEVNYVMVRTKE